MMNDSDDATKGRRIFLAAATAVAGGAALGSAPAVAMSSRYASSLKMLAEGEVTLDWVLTLLNLPQVPPGTRFGGRYEFPSPLPAFQGKDVMSLLIYVVFPPGLGLPAGPVPISALNIAIEDIVLDRAAFGGPANPANNVVMSGRVASIEVLSPFGDLTGRAFMIGFGFEWLDAQHSSAKFKLLAGSGAGSHVTVAREADGFIEIKRPWQSY
jgi:hypothetical protein